jgi:hypothetical protein
MREVISVAVALTAAYVLGWCGRGEREKRLARRPKTLEQLAREQGVKRWTGIDDIPTADPELFTEEDLASWDAAIRDVRGGGA